MVQLSGNRTIQHLGGALQRALSDGRTIQHCGQLLPPRRFIEGLDDGYDATIALTLGDLEMQISECGNLREVGYDDDLVILRQ